MSEQSPTPSSKQNIPDISEAAIPHDPNDVPDISVDPLSNLNIDRLPTDSEGNPWVPWEVAEQAGYKSPQEQSYTTSIGEPGKDKQTMETLSEILADKGIGVVKLGHPAGYKQLYDHLTDDEVEEARIRDASERGVDPALGHAQAEQLRHNVHSILEARGERDGVRYILQPGKFTPGARELVDQEEHPRPDNDVIPPARSRHGVPISPKGSENTFTVHKKDRPEEYQPRIIEGLGKSMRGSLRGTKEIVGGRVSEFGIVKGGVSRVKKLTSKLSRSSDPATRRKL